MADPRFKLSQITQIMRDNGAPVWELFFITGFEKNLASSYLLPENKTEDSVTRDEVEVSIQTLTAVLKNYPKRQTMAIVLRKSNKSARQYGFGPYVFYNVHSSEEDEQAETELSGMPRGQQAQKPFNPMAEGFIPESLMEARLAVMQKEMAVEMQRQLLELDRKRFQEEQQQALKGLQDKEEKYSNNSEMVKNGLNMAFTELIGAFMNKPPSSPLGKVTQEETAEQSRRETIAEAIASEFYHEQDLSDEELESFQKMIPKMIASVKQKRAKATAQPGDGA
jgi:hypothetical protein